MRKLQYIFSALLITSVVNAQDKPLGTEVINVVKPYTPSIADAFKLRELPSISDSIILTKKKIKYTIFSVPVASTFTPAKGVASSVRKGPKEQLYNSYASLGVGNYSNVVFDFYTGMTLSRNDAFDVGVRHHSSQGGIADVLVEDHFFDSKIDLGYTYRDRDMAWGIRAGALHKVYNWYGIPQEQFINVALNDMSDVHQRYLGAEVGAKVEFEDAIFESAELLVNGMWDRFDSNETRFVFKPKFSIPSSNENIQLVLTADYLNGNFNRNFEGSNGIDYGYLLAGATPSFELKKDDVTLKLGASIFYGRDTKANDGNLYIYPQITASYRLIDEYVTIYGGIEGGLEQNSYRAFVDENPFVSPTLTIRPTDMQYDAYAGIKGKFLPNLGYHFKGSYTAARDRALFLSNPMDTTGDSFGYKYGNSFGIVYDHVKTFSGFGELSVDINRDFTLGINAEVMKYTLSEEEEAWNLPKIRGSFFMDYQINEQWYAGANLFYMGEREDMFSKNQLLSPNDPTYEAPQQITLDSYFDVNFNVGYRFNKQLSAFVKVNNLTSNTYARWMDYQVQGLQILGGAIYKFDL